MVLTYRVPMLAGLHGRREYFSKLTVTYPAELIDFRKSIIVSVIFRSEVVVLNCRNGIV